MHGAQQPACWCFNDYVHGCVHVLIHVRLHDRGHNRAHVVAAHLNYECANEYSLCHVCDFWFSVCDSLGFDHVYSFIRVYVYVYVNFSFLALYCCHVRNLRYVFFTSKDSFLVNVCSCIHVCVRFHYGDGFKGLILISSLPTKYGWSVLPLLLSIDFATDW